MTYIGFYGSMQRGHLGDDPGAKIIVATDQQHGKMSFISGQLKPESICTKTY